METMDILQDIQLDLFEAAHIMAWMSVLGKPKGLETGICSIYWSKKMNWKFILTTSQQFLVIRNYAKITSGLFAEIIGKISALTVLQYVNFNNKPIGRIKYALN